MPRVKVKYLNVYYSMTHKEEEFIAFDDAFTLGELLDKVSEIYKPKFRDSIFDKENNLKPHAWILVNKEIEKDLKRRLKGGEVVVFSLPVVGG